MDKCMACIETNAMKSARSRQAGPVPWEHRGRGSGTRIVAAEMPVAFVYGGSTEAVMMATPADFEDYALPE
jgi:FdhD protein